MRKLSFIGVLMLFFVAVLTVSAADSERAKPSAGPMAIIDQRSYTFPETLEGVEARHDFVIRNVGDAPLIIHEVKAA